MSTISIREAIILVTQERLSEAEVGCREAVKVYPQVADYWAILGVALALQNRPEEAEVALRSGLAVNPTHLDCRNNLGMALWEQGRIEEAKREFQVVLRQMPTAKDTHSNLLCCDQYLPGITPADMAATHAEWERRHAAALRSTWRPHAVVRDPNRRLRLGFVSPNFQAAVGYFLIRAFEQLDRDQCETVGYCDKLASDHLTARFKAAATAWREVRNLSDEALAEQVRADRIDVLFDLTGHTSQSRLLVFARKPAPIQVTWIGYEGTTGLSAMDYIVADDCQIAPGEEGYYREKVLRLPGGYICYDPPADAPDVGPLPAATRGYVTFASFNNPAKMTPLVVGAWSEILRRVPGSRLVLKFRSMDSPQNRRRFLDRFAAQGIGPDRLDLRGFSPHGEYLSQHHDIDIALDPFPFSGSLTTCNSLWMGVPVVACRGATFASRHSWNHLSSVGLAELLAGDVSQYVELAVALSQDLGRLAALRAGLRDRVRVSPLCDGQRVARHLLQAVRQAWREWNQGCV